MVGGGCKPLLNSKLWYQLDRHTLAGVGRLLTAGLWNRVESSQEENCVRWNLCNAGSPSRNLSLLRGEHQPQPNLFVLTRMLPL